MGQQQGDDGGDMFRGTVDNGVSEPGALICGQRGFLFPCWLKKDLKMATKPPQLPATASALVYELHPASHQLGFGQQ